MRWALRPHGTYGTHGTYELGHISLMSLIGPIRVRGTTRRVSEKAAIFTPRAPHAASFPFRAPLS